MGLSPQHEEFCMENYYLGLLEKSIGIFYLMSPLSHDFLQNTLDMATLVSLKIFDSWFKSNKFNAWVFPGQFVDCIFLVDRQFMFQLC